jgi:hypothetical protein
MFKNRVYLEFWEIRRILKIKNLLDFNIYNYNILDEKNNLDELKKSGKLYIKYDQ